MTDSELYCYTYVLNNPLKFTDPSGYVIDGPGDDLYWYQNYPYDVPYEERSYRYGVFSMGSGYTIWGTKSEWNALSGTHDAGPSSPDELKNYIWEKALRMSESLVGPNDEFGIDWGIYVTHGKGLDVYLAGIGVWNGSKLTNYWFNYEVKNSTSFDPVAFYWSTYGMNPRVGTEYLDTDIFLGLSGTNNLMAIAASGSKIGKRFLKGSGLLLTSLNAFSMAHDISLSNSKQWGNYSRLTYNTIFGIADLKVPFLGFVLGACDNLGIFEPHYHQMDVLQQTGYWVYYNIYKREMQYIKLRR